MKVSELIAWLDKYKDNQIQFCLFNKDGEIAGDLGYFSCNGKFLYEAKTKNDELVSVVVGLTKNVDLLTK